MNTHRDRASGERAGKLRRKVFLGSVSTLAIASFSAAAFAQEAASSGEVETVVVTGLRGSLQRSLDIKRDAVGVVDAISSEDIGKFPDSNVAAAIQRIPGVSVSRGATSMGSTGTTTSTGAATEITVRGFGPNFNQTLFDGRVISIGANGSASTGNTRGFDFSALGADFISQVDVLKTPDASLSSGAIGATINIKYPKPFDHPGLVVAASASSSYSPDEEKYTPNGSLLFSDTFANDTFGILADIDYTDTKTRGNHVNIQGWEGRHLFPCQHAGGPACAPGDTREAAPSWFIQDYGIYQEHTEEKRTDGRVVLQWRPSDSLLFTANFDYSKNELTQQQFGYSVWFSNDNLTNVITNPHGTITDFVQPGTPTDFQAQQNGSVLENQEYGLNAMWAVSSRFNVELDGDHARSRLNPNNEFSAFDMDVGYGGPNTVALGITGIGKDSIPYPNAFGPGGDGSRTLDPTIIGSHVLPIQSFRNQDTLDQFKAVGTWSQDSLEIRFGVQYIKDAKELRSFDTFANNFWQAYSGYGPQSGSATGINLPDEFFNRSFGTSGFISGFSNNNKLPPRLLMFNPFQVAGYLSGLGDPQASFIPGFNYCTSPCSLENFHGQFDLAEEAGSHQDITEKTIAGFVTTNYETRVADMPLKISAGVRWEQTDVISVGIGQLPTKLTVQTGDPTAFDVTYGPQTAVSHTNTYTYLLPNLDLNLSLTDELKLRFDASRSLSRPPLNLITPVLNVGPGQRTNSLNATGGNPDLLPFLSDNVDVGLEWYYAPNSYASIDGFVKEVSNFIVGGTTQQNINGVIDPNTGLPAVFSVTTNVNGPSAEVRGLEFSWQHVFGDSGFGFQANATLVDTDKPFQPSNISTSGFAVTGLADSANLVVFYENYGFQARVALNWRDEYLDHFGQLQNGSNFGTEPTFVNASTTVDASTSYDINDHFQVYLEGFNLTDETYSTHGRYGEQLLDAVDTGRRFVLGIHARL